MHLELLGEVGCEASLAEMDRERVRSRTPLKMDTKEPLDGAHEINGERLGEKTLEFLLRRIVEGEVNEVIDVKSEGER